MPRKLLNVVCNGECFGSKRPVFKGVKAEGCTLKNGTLHLLTAETAAPAVQEHNALIQSGMDKLRQSLFSTQSISGWKHWRHHFTHCQSSPSIPRDAHHICFLHLIHVMHVVLVPGMAFHAFFDASFRCLDVSWSRMCISILTLEDTENHADPHSTNSHPNHHPFFVAFLRLWSLSFSSWAPHLPSKKQDAFCLSPCFWGSPGPLGAFPSVHYMPLW